MSAPYATDYTSIVHRRARLATANDINLSGLPGGGLDLKAAGVGLVGALVAAAVVLPLWWLFVPVTLWFSAPIFVIVFIPVYWVAQRETEGRETFGQRVQLTVMRVVKQPTQIAGMAADKEPTHFTWVMIVARPAGMDGPALPVRQFENYGYLGDQPSEPIQGRAWPAADESVADWQRRVWWESGGELLDSMSSSEEEKI